MVTKPRLAALLLNVQRDRQWSARFSPTPYHRPRYRQNHSDATSIATEHLFPGRDEGQLLPYRLANQRSLAYSNVALRVGNLLKNEQNHFLKEPPLIDRQSIDLVLGDLALNIELLEF